MSSMRNFSQNFTGRVSKKLLLSYLFVFLLPFVVLSVYLFFSLTLSTQREFQWSNKKMMGQLSAKLERNFIELGEITLDMAVNDAIERPRDYPSPVQTSTEQELRRYVMLSRIVDNIFLYYTDSPTMYSTSGTMSEQVFLATRAEYEKMSKTELRRALSEKKPRLVTDKDNAGDHLYYFVPFVSREGQVVGRVVYVLSISEMKRVIDTELLSNEEELLFFVQNNLAFQVGVEENIPLKDLFEKSEVRVGNRDFLVHQEEIMPDVSLSAIGLFDKSKAQQMAIPVVAGFLIVLGMFLIVSFVIILFVSYKQYQPIYQLNKVYREISKHENKDDDILNRVGDYLFQTKLNLDEQVQEARNFQTIHFFEQLLLGHFNSEEDITREMKRLSIPLKNSHHYLVGVTNSNLTDDDEVNLKVKTVLVNQLFAKNENYSVHYIELPQKSLLVFLFSFNQFIESEELFANYLQENFGAYLRENIGLDLNISYGHIEKSLKAVNLSYFTALSRKEIEQKEENSLATTKNANETFLPVEKTETLLQAIKHGSVHLVEKILEELFAQRADVLPKELLKSYQFYVLNELVLLAETNHLVHLIEVAKVSFYPSKIKDEILRFSLILSQEFSKVNQQTEKQEENKLLDMIESNYMNPMFSLDEMAMHFDVSLSKMSQMIKEETGNNFSKYVQQLRIDKAKELLIATNKPVKEIVLDIGYSDISNFTRKFRETVGLPPGEFRKVNKA
ncbi:helix-turn-helix domain-containing protein [Pilibacter termitis]|nr:helix-turn-helix domain-containing protein [Pilibacter termitis]